MGNERKSWGEDLRDKRDGTDYPNHHSFPLFSPVPWVLGVIVAFP